MAVETKKILTGVFCWADLNTTDVAGAKAFYQGLFGWGGQDYPMPEGEPYTMFQVDGKSIGGLSALGEEAKKMGAPPHWLNYVAVDDADAYAKKAKDLGGTVHAGPFDVMDAGRMAVLADPTGGTFALWQAKGHPGVEVAAGTPGSICWNELMTLDTAKAQAFYTGMFGYTTETMDMDKEGSAYTIFMTKDPETPREAGMMKVEPGMPQMSYWLLYFGVTDCDAIAKKAESLGGKVLHPPTDIPPGRFAVVQDPQGAVFGVLQGRD